MPQDLIRRVLMKLDKNYLPYEYFERLKFFIPTEVFSGAEVTRLPTRYGVYLHTKLEEGTEIISHYHNSKEYLYVTKGRALLNDRVILQEGDEFSFKPFELHHIKALEECEMYVQFMKDETFKKLK